MRRALEQQGWWQEASLEGGAIDEQVLYAIHTPEYIRKLRAASETGAFLDADTYTTPQSWEIACRTAGRAAELAGAVWRGEAQAGFALCRPPGHHATPDRGMGFCLLNNIALAAEHLLQKEGASRLAIVDIDLHHGNGTQDVFYHREEVLFISTHQSPLYPGTGMLRETGGGPGEGTTVNLPFPPGTGDEGMQTAMETIVLPLLERFQAEMLLVSAGFDAHWRDPLGSLQTTAAGTGRQVAMLKEWAGRAAGGRIALFLEGGYDPEAIKACTLAAAAALRGENWEDPLGPAPLPETNGWQAVIEEARQIWGL